MTIIQAGAPKIPSGGTASTPGLAVAGDSNTGLRGDTADQLGVTCGGTEQARFGATYGIDVKVGGLKFSAGPLVGTFVSVAPATGSHNNYAVTNTFLLDIDTSGGNVTLTGLSMGQVDGQVVIIHKTGANNLVLNHNDSNSLAANRFAVNGGANLTVTGGSGIIVLVYRSSTWRAGKLAV